MDAASELQRLEQRRGSAGALASPRLRAFFETWLDTFVFNGGIDARLREQTILRVMWRCGRVDEWSNHYRLAQTVGLSDEEVVAIRTDDPARDLDGALAVAVCAADEVVDVGRVTADTMAALRDVFPDELLLQEFLYLVAGYRMFATVSASTPEVHQGSTWLPDGVGPEVD